MASQNPACAKTEYADLTKPFARDTHDDENPSSARNGTVMLHPNDTYVHPFVCPTDNAFIQDASVRRMHAARWLMLIGLALVASLVTCMGMYVAGHTAAATVAALAVFMVALYFATVTAITFCAARFCKASV
jgi:hypothetical protein